MVLKELGEDDFKDKLETKLYTIVDEAVLARDLAVIEKQYLDKGYYLAKASYSLTDAGPNEVELVYQVEEGAVVKVGSVDVVGNKYFSSEEIVSKLFLRPFSRMSTFASPGSIYQDDFLKRDLEFLSYLYRDQGFAKVKVGRPTTLLDADRAFVRLGFEVEEGLQYNTGSIEFRGDILFPVEELKEEMSLKSGELFRYSRFQKDVDHLVDKYGDLGYAFVDVNPIPEFDEGTTPPRVNLVFEIAKGDKVFFGSMTVVGNSKTRDNVVRREMEVAEAQLYSGTGLTKSKTNLERLGFFEEIQLIRSRDPKNQSLLDYKVRVKEKPTGQLQAAIGFQPGQDTPGNKFFGQLRYNEENQSGYGWSTGLSGKWNGQKNYGLIYLLPILGFMTASGFLAQIFSSTIRLEILLKISTLKKVSMALVGRLVVGLLSLFKRV